MTPREVLEILKRHFGEPRDKRQCGARTTYTWRLGLKRIIDWHKRIESARTLPHVVYTPWSAGFSRRKIETVFELTV
jgi:hypothetical protein